MKKPLSISSVSLELAQDFFHLFYPEQCTCCSATLTRQEKLICTSCLHTLPLTYFHLQPTDNPVSKMLWGKVFIQYASALLFFQKQGKVQRLIHGLKYKGFSEIGEIMGKMHGIQLSQENEFQEIDAIIPVPLHQKRERKRGYNQSLHYAMGLSKAMKKPILQDTLKRNTHKISQTNKKQFARWKNVSEAFEVKDLSAYENQHFLLVDDVITTGSTLEACAQALLSIKGAKVSVATIAYAQ